MAKLLLVSVLIASIMIPYAAARGPQPYQGLRRMLLRSTVFMVGYGVALRFVYARLQ